MENWRGIIGECISSFPPAGQILTTFLFANALPCFRCPATRYRNAAQCAGNRTPNTQLRYRLARGGPHATQDSLSKFRLMPRDIHASRELHDNLFR
jgi:hypothetical protein